MIVAKALAFAANVASFITNALTFAAIIAMNL